MADVTRRRTGELLGKLFDIFKRTSEGVQAAAALKQLANSVQLTEYEAANYSSGSRRFEKIVRSMSSTPGYG
jgi:restriction system protein